MKRLPDQTIPALKAALQPDGTFLDRDFIRAPGIGRVTLGRLVELGWAVEAKRDTDWSTRYQLTEIGREAISRS